MANEKIKDYAKKKGVKLWEIADSMNMLDYNFSRKLRKALSKDESQKITKIIDEIAKRKA